MKARKDFAKISPLDSFTQLAGAQKRITISNDKFTAIIMSALSTDDLTAVYVTLTLRGSEKAVLINRIPASFFAERSDLISGAQTYKTGAATSRIVCRIDTGLLQVSGTDELELMIEGAITARVSTILSEDKSAPLIYDMAVDTNIAETDVLEVWLNTGTDYGLSGSTVNCKMKRLDDGSLVSEDNFQIQDAYSTAMSLLETDASLDYKSIPILFDDDMIATVDVNITLSATGFNVIFVKSHVSAESIIAGGKIEAAKSASQIKKISKYIPSSKMASVMKILGGSYLAEKTKPAVMLAMKK